MQRQRGELVPIGEALADLDGPVKAIRSTSPQAVHHFTQADQVNLLVGASEADPEIGFMARMMVLCSLPRTNPGNRYRYVRQNGPYKLIMYSSGETKLPYGNFPRLILAWVSTEAVKTQVDPGRLAGEVHAGTRNLQQRREGGNQTPQPNAAAVRLQCSTDLQGCECGAVRELSHCRERRILVESATARPALTMGQ